MDHISLDDEVLCCDISSSPLEDASLDVAVFSLSLMGANWREYLKEAYRTLKPYGYLFIAEPKRKWQERVEELKEAVEESGFQLMGDVRQRYDFLYLSAMKA
jgi:ubiquinone/menaquinone biosynthesis C-methylase UbiE